MAIVKARGKMSSRIKDTIVNYKQMRSKILSIKSLMSMASYKLTQ
jgi:hypothetical protein